MPYYPPASTGGGAPTDATYLTQTANGTLSAEQAMGSLSTGLVKNTTTTGVQSIAAEGTDYWKPGGTDVAVADGGTGASTLTDHGVVISHGTSALTSIAPSTSGNVLTSNGTDWASTAPASGGATTEIIAMVAPQVNVSSIGNTYTDTAGNTYAETTNQTRVTLSAARTRTIAMEISGHVSAGTGTFELFNFTDTASLGTATTTSTSEAIITTTQSGLATNNGDAITIRVKNSGAGGTTTIDAGGLLEGDSQFATFSSTGVKNIAQFATPGFIADCQLAIIKKSTGATITAQPVLLSNTVDAATFIYPVGASISAAQANSVITRTPTIKTYAASSSGVSLSLNVTAVSGTYAWRVGIQVKADNI